MLYKEVMTDDPLILEAIEVCGGTEAKLASAAGVTQPAIHKAKKTGRVSAELALRIEKATRGRVALWQMRPDLASPPRTKRAPSTQSEPVEKVA